MTDLRTLINSADPVPTSPPEIDAQVHIRRIIASQPDAAPATRRGSRIRSRTALAATLGVALIGGGVAVATLGPAEHVATAHLLAPPIIVSGVGSQDVVLPDSPEKARYVSWELACFDSTTCGTTAGSVTGPSDGVKVDRGFLPTTAERDDTNPQELAPLTARGLPVHVDEGSHWRLYAVYTDAYEFDNGRLSNGKTLGIPGLEPADYLPAVTTDGKDGWISYNDLTYGADVELTPTGVRQEPLPVYAGDGATKIGVTNLNGTTPR